MTNASGSRRRLTYATEESFGVLSSGTEGYQEVVLSTATAGGDATGLSNDATGYHCTIAVDGGSAQDIYIIGAEAQTYTALLQEINLKLDDATIAFSDTTHLRVTSDSKGVSSAIAITDTDLFSTLTNYDSIDTDVDGTGNSDATFYLLPQVSVELTNNQSTFEDPTIRSDRNVAFYRYGNKTPSGTIVTPLRYGAFDTLLEGVLAGSWTGDVLKNGVTFPSFQFEVGDTDISRYSVFDGCKLSSLNLALQPDGIIQMTFNVMGRDVTRGASEVQTPTTPPANANVSMVHHEGAATYDGSAIATITNFNLTIDNGLQHDSALFSKLPSDISYRKCRVTGTLSAYLTDNAIADDWDTEQEVALIFTMLDPAGNSYSVNMPKVKLTNYNDPQGDDGPIIESFGVMATYDSGIDAVIEITRTSA